VAIQAGIVLWMLDAWRHDQQARATIDDHERDSTVQAEQVAPAKPPSMPETPNGNAAAASLPEIRARVPTTSNSTDDAYPHPLTPEREDIQHELRLIGALNDALDLGDATQMRKLIATYREHHPNDENKLQLGYERLADCLEQPGEASRTAAQQYYDQERASTLRRYIRRTCLESPAAPTAPTTTPN
jgi:hypothetical protein